MPSKNKPKRLDRARSWRVARRKKKREDLIKGTKRSRPKRPKHKGRVSEENIKEKSIEKKVVKKVVKEKE